VEANPLFFRDLAYVFLAAICGGMLAWRLRQPIILGYVLAGMLISPFTPGPSVTHVHTMELFAEIGVILLMFSVGLEFSIKDLLSVRWVALIGGPLGIVLSIGAGLLVGRFMGWTSTQGIVIGCVISVASTMVLTRLLIDRGELNMEHGRVMVAITLVEDLAVVILIILLPNFGSLDSARLLALGKSLGKAALILVPALFLAAKILPAVLRRVARTRSPELFFGVVLAIGLGTAALTQAVGLSLALGAFVAGLMIAESPYAQEALAQLFPVRDSFVALFFVTLGLLVDPRSLFADLPLLGAMVALILFGKFVIWGLVVRIFGYPMWTAILVGVGLTQIGEFSFILVQVARNSGLVDQGVYNATLAASLISILVNAALIRYVPAWIGQARLARQTVALAPASEKLAKHVVLSGYGRMGSEVGTALDTFGIPYVVIDMDPDIVETLRARGVRCFYGDLSHEHILEEAHTADAALVILTVPDAEKNEFIIRGVRRMNLNVPIVTRSQARADQEHLMQAGASRVIQPELEASATMIHYSLEYLSLPPDEAHSYLERFREALGTAHTPASTDRSALPAVLEIAAEQLPVVDQTLRESRIRERYGVTVVAVERNSGEMIVNPSPDTMILPGDKIRIFGLRQQIQSLLSEKT